MKEHRVVFFLLFFLLACSVSDQAQIEQILKQRGEAFRNKDFPLYVACFSSDYQDATGDLSSLRNRVEGYFKTFDRIEYESSDRSIQIQGDEATVVQQFRIEVERGGKKNHSSGKEAFLLKKEGRQWKIIKGF